MIQLPSQNTPVAEGPRFPMSRTWFQWFRDLLNKTQHRLAPTSILTAAYTARPFDLVRVDPSGGVFTVTLPTNALDGTEVAYKNTTADTTTVTIAAATGDTVEGAASITNSTALGSEHLVYSATGRDWSRI